MVKPVSKSPVDVDGDTEHQIASELPIAQSVSVRTAAASGGSVAPVKCELVKLQKRLQQHSSQQLKLLRASRDNAVEAERVAKNEAMSLSRELCAITDAAKATKVQTKADAKELERT